MLEPEFEGTPPGEREQLWRGIDLSGMTAVLGVGSGELIRILGEQAAIADGHILGIDYDFSALQSLRAYVTDLPVTALNARLRSLPLADESIDLLVMNGTLRQVPERHFETMFREIWRVLVPGGHLRIVDIMPPNEEPYAEAWRVRNGLISRLGAAFGQPVALYVNLKSAAAALVEAGFEELAVSILPGLPLSDAWLESTMEALHAMASRVADPTVQRAIVQEGLPQLASAFSKGEQRAPERFVLQGTKVGNLALDMRASFTEADLMDDSD